jgi:hypothetical protein
MSIGSTKNQDRAGQRASVIFKVRSGAITAEEGARLLLTDREAACHRTKTAMFWALRFCVAESKKASPCGKAFYSYAASQNRTVDTRIFSPLLYRLS